MRGKVMDGLVRAWKAGELHFAGTSADLAVPGAFEALRRTLYGAAWVAYAKRPFGDAEHVIAYLSRYTHRVGISSSRLVSADDDAVVFRTRGPGTCRLTPREFLRRFLLHVLPFRFRKVRHAGLSAPSNVGTRLAAAQRLVAAMSRRHRRAQPERDVTHVDAGHPAAGDVCPRCLRGTLVPVPFPSARGPP